MQLSEQEKREIVEDAKSIQRQKDFRFARKMCFQSISLDGYIISLQSLQRVMGQFAISLKRTLCNTNKL
jgi:hypothetical protein